jgi:hypothetical protein
MPEGGAEHQLAYSTHHRCPQANALVREFGNDVDLLIFPVGNYGFGMPLNQVFAVTALEECKACGRLLTAQFVWRRGHTHHGGRLWIPDGSEVEL